MNKTKIAIQVLVSLIMIYVSEVKLEGFGDLFGVSYPLQLGVLSIPITVIAVIALTNAINMIDGLDGLASGIILLGIIGIICFNLPLEFSPFTGILLAAASALLPFIFFNVAPYTKFKVFLGDGGSLFLGYFISWVLIYSAENINNFPHTFALWCVAIPLFDFFTVIIIRVVNKKSLVIARKDHIHHQLENLGFSKQLTLLVIFGFGLTILIIGIFVEKNFPTLSFSVFLILFLFYLFIRMFNKFLEKIKRYL